MKILLVSTSSGSQGGGELCLPLIGKGLREAAHEVVLWTSTHPRMDGLVKAFGPIGEVVRFSYRNTYDYPARALGHWRSYTGGTGNIERSWKAVAPDVIHINKQNLEDGLDLLLAANRAGLPAVSMIHITQSARYLKARNALLRDLTARFFLRRFRGRFITTTNRAAELVRFVGNPQTVVGIDNGVVVPGPEERAEARKQARESLGLCPDDFLILGLGRLEAQKRPTRFLRMVEAAHRAFPNPKIWWVGAGRLEAEWDTAVEQMDFKTRPERLGWKDAVQPYLAAADLFVHSAAFEGLPFGLLEALAWGLPAVICDDLAAELPTACRDACVVVGPENDDWIRPLTDSEYRKRISRHAVETAREHYSVERMVRDYLNVYQRQREDTLR